MMLTGKSLIAGVIGCPVTHSLSPRLHGFWLQYYGIDGIYIPLEVAPEHLGHIIAALPKMHFRGVNITVPHKENVMHYVDYVDPVARHIGAVNTIIVEKDGSLTGKNTDSYGFIQNIKANLPPSWSFEGKKAVILGAGGAARAVIAGLIEEKMSGIILLNRTKDKAEQIAEHFGHTMQADDWDKRHDILAEADILVNTTVLGMEGQSMLDLRLDALKPTSLVTDIVYKPLMTPLLDAAKKRGNPVVDGLGMLLFQAEKGFELWYGKKPEVTEALRQFVLEGLDKRIKE